MIFAMIQSNKDRSFQKKDLQPLENREPQDDTEDLRINIIANQCIINNNKHNI
jgi:hypothetical protein